MTVYTVFAVIVKIVISACAVVVGWCVLGAGLSLFRRPK